MIGGVGGSTFRIRSKLIDAPRERVDGGEATVADAAAFLREKFDISALTIRAHLVYAAREGVLKIVKTPGHRAPVVK